MTPSLVTLRTVAAGVTLALLAACGSTVPQRVGGGDVAFSDQDLDQPGLGEDELTLGEDFGDGDLELDSPPRADSGGTQAGPSASGMQPAGSSGGAGEGQAPAPSGQAQSAPSSSGQAASSSGPQPTGVTADKVFVGATYSPNSGAANAAFGAAGTDPGDQRDYYNAVIKDLNARGGLGDRMVEPVYFELDSNSTASMDTQHQAACTHWTQDNQVFAILDGNSAVTRQCGHDAGIVTVTSSFSSSTSQTFKQFPRYVEISAVRLDRIGRVVMPGLHDQGYFDAGAKIGVVTWDEANYIQAVETDFTTALARYGQKIDEVAHVKAPQTMNQVGDSQAEVSAAVLRFKTRGVSHVMILDGPAGVAKGTVLTLLFMQTAETQAYRPRYGFNTTNSQGNETRFLFPDAQLERAVGVIWGNETTETDEGVGPNPQRERCLKLMRDNGVDMDNTNAQGFALRACNDLWFLEKAVAAGGGGLSAERVMAGVDRMGDSFRGTTSFGNHFGPDQRDGAAFVRNIANDSGCNCYVYPGPIYRPQ